ncbi:hypothetical protein [Actinomadura fibrosa]|uniref:ATP-grasp domain-containing protein n=1 Tax=Actinomadura fibrosa TaxID=111802 RepID=A0ABW2XGI7_9ACTN|nr:hypothetical protein [Actinomadura fibrosa]
MVTASATDAAALPAELAAASTFQPIVRGTSIRLTAVGPHLFAVRITGTDLLDWRPVQDRLTFTATEIPPAIATGVHAFLRAYGLEYGAFDFIDPGPGRPWSFLECNPSGMYGMVEIQSGLRITAAIADRLLTPLNQGSAGCSIGSP